MLWNQISSISNSMQEYETCNYKVHFFLNFYWNFEELDSGLEQSLKGKWLAFTKFSLFKSTSLLSNSIIILFLPQGNHQNNELTPFPQRCFVLKLETKLSILWWSVLCPDPLAARLFPSSQHVHICFHNPLKKQMA